jgi:pimeloyl-ACP methyl ester carboxylesterase
MTTAIPLRDITLHVRDTETDGPPLLMGPSYLLTHRVFDALIEALQDDYRCITWDWRGQGASDVPDDGYGIPSLAADVTALMDSLGIEQAAYVGHSMGGYVGFRLLLDHPDRISRAVLMNTQAQSESTLQRMKYNALLKIVETTGFAPVIDQVVPLLLGERYRAAHPDEADFWRDQMKGNAPTGTVRLGRAIFGRSSVLSDLGRVSKPVLMLAGSEDDVVPLDNVRATHDALPNSTMVIAPGSGHSTPIEQPDTALNAIERFFEETTEATGHQP